MGDNDLMQLEEEITREKSMIANDPDYKSYKQLRDKQRVKPLKTNIDLLEQFNNTALKFVPLYKKRIDQVDSVEKIHKQIVSNNMMKKKLKNNLVKN